MCVNILEEVENLNKNSSIQLYFAILKFLALNMLLIKFGVKFLLKCARTKLI